MILGTPRGWVIAAGLAFVLGIALLATGSGGTLGAVGGLLLVILAVVLFGVAPMRYGRSEQRPATESTVPDDPATAAEAPPRPRAKIKGGDPSEV